MRKATASGPSRSPTGPKAATPPMKAKKITTGWMARPRRMSSGFTTLSMVATTPTAQAARKMPATRWPVAILSTARATTSRVARPMGASATTKVTTPKKRALGTPATRYPRSARTAWAPAVATVEASTATVTRRKSSQSSAAWPGLRGIASLIHRTRPSPSTSRKKKATRNSTVCSSAVPVAESTLPMAAAARAPSCSRSAWTSCAPCGSPASSWAAGSCRNWGREATSPSSPPLCSASRAQRSPWPTCPTSMAVSVATGPTTASSRTRVTSPAASGRRPRSRRASRSENGYSAAAKTAATNSALAKGRTMSTVSRSASTTMTAWTRRAVRGAAIVPPSEVQVDAGRRHAGPGQPRPDVVHHGVHAGDEGHRVARRRSAEGEGASHLLHVAAHALPGVVLARGAEHHPHAAALPGGVLAAIGEVGPVPLPVEEGDAAEALPAPQEVLHQGADGGDAGAGGEEEHVPALGLGDREPLAEGRGQLQVPARSRPGHGRVGDAPAALQEEVGPPVGGGPAGAREVPLPGPGADLHHLAREPVL